MPDEQEYPIVGTRDNLKELMELAKDDFADVIPKHLTAERLLKMVLVAASRQPKLFQCTRASILQSAMRSAELGLDCSGTLGEGYLVPYFNSTIKKLEAQFIPGYRGFIKLARNSGQLDGIEAHVVYQGDKFHVIYGTEQVLTHEPNLDGKRGPMRCVYAIGRLKDSLPQIEVMSRADVESVKASSKAADSGPWRTHESEMWRKTAVRRLAKYLPLSPELEKVLAIENEVESRPEYAKTAVADVQNILDMTPAEFLKAQAASVAKEGEPEVTTTATVSEPAPVVTEPEPAPKRKPGRPPKGDTLRCATCTSTATWSKELSGQNCPVCSAPGKATSDD